MFLLDTNVLLYALDRDAPEHKPCRRLVESCLDRTEPWGMTWGILYEFLRVATHRNVLRKPLTLAQAWSFLEPLLASPGLQVLQETARHGALLAELNKVTPGLSGNLLFDVRTAVLMREHGVQRIYTRDADFRRFKGLDVLDPLA